MHINPNPASDVTPKWLNAVPSKSMETLPLTLIGSGLHPAHLMQRKLAGLNPCVRLNQQIIIAGTLEK